MFARLDSWDPHRGGRCFRFAAPAGVLRADNVAEVLPVLRQMEAAVAEGMHAVGWVAYEAAPAFDAALAVRTPEPGLPLACFGLFQERHEDDPGDSGSGRFELGTWTASLDEPEHRARVEQIRELIRAGDTYQVNLSFRLRALFAGDPAALYAHLCRFQGAAFCAHLQLDRFSVLSASPELFFRWAGDELELRPMKGTRPRGRWLEEDGALAAELLASPKERAENLMIVDLLRNDAGRVAEWGTVRVPHLFQVESYPTVHQMTSTIHARTRPGTTLPDVFAALFPCGSVTGAPKIRTSQIIAECEDSPRGVYTGAIGFASPGEAVFNVAIRTVVVDHAAGTAVLGVGSGITYDSEPGAEYRECLAKAAFARDAPPEFDLLETMLVDSSGQLFLLDGHLDRIARSAERFGFRCDREGLRALLENTAADLPPLEHRLRLMLARDGAARVEHAVLDPGARPLRVGIAPEPVHSADVLLYHKTTHREAYTRRLGSRPDCDEVLLINERGELTEFANGNLAVELDGARWTPPVSAGLLPGVFREHLLARGEIQERTLRPEDLPRATRIWLINSVRRWRVAVLA